MTHIMLDIETWGRTPGSDIRSIGAVVFDPVAGTVAGFDASAPEGHRITSLDGKFYIAANNGTRYGLTREPETIQWWIEQSAEAQAAFANPVDLQEALVRFAVWIGILAGCTPSAAQHVRLWANDPHFDVSILDACYRAVGLTVPWHYRAPRSQKTITDAAGMTRADYEPFNYGTAHNALDDAISQAMIVCEAYRRLELQR